MPSHTVYTRSIDVLSLFSDRFLSCIVTLGLTTTTQTTSPHLLSLIALQHARGGCARCGVMACQDCV